MCDSISLGLWLPCCCCCCCCRRMLIYSSAGALLGPFCLVQLRGLAERQGLHELLTHVSDKQHMYRHNTCGCPQQVDQALLCVCLVLLLD